MEPDVSAEEDGEGAEVELVLALLPLFAERMTSAAWAQSVSHDLEAIQGGVDRAGLPSPQSRTLPPADALLAASG